MAMAKYLARHTEHLNGEFKAGRGHRNFSGQITFDHDAMEEAVLYALTNEFSDKYDYTVEFSGTRGSSGITAKVTGTKKPADQIALFSGDLITEGESIVIPNTGVVVIPEDPANNMNFDPDFWKGIKEKEDEEKLAKVFPASKDYEEPAPLNPRALLFGGVDNPEPEPEDGQVKPSTPLF